LKQYDETKQGRALDKTSEDKKITGKPKGIQTLIITNQI
jgi:hypothetical protein